MRKIVSVEEQVLIDKVAWNNHCIKDYSKKVKIIYKKPEVKTYGWNGSDDIEEKKKKLNKI